MSARYKVMVTTFENPNGERVSQVFLGGMTISRETASFEQAIGWAKERAASLAPSSVEVVTWTAEDGEHAYAA